MLRQFELIEKLRSYDPTADEALLNRASVYAMRMHGAQQRASGDPYFAHPIEVARLLPDYSLATPTTVPSLLPAWTEDTPAPHAHLDPIDGAPNCALADGSPTQHK